MEEREGIVDGLQRTGIVSRPWRGDVRDVVEVPKAEAGLLGSPPRPFDDSIELVLEAVVCEYELEDVDEMVELGSERIPRVDGMHEAKDGLLSLFVERAKHAIPHDEDTSIVAVKVSIKKVKGQQLMQSKNIRINKIKNSKNFLFAL
jgi:hypothetical protein